MSVVPAKLLLDENISPKLPEKLAHEGGTKTALDACHVRDSGLAATEREVLDRARAVHPGIIMFENGAATRDEQLRYVRAAANRASYRANRGSCDGMGAGVAWASGRTSS